MNNKTDKKRAGLKKIIFYVMLVAFITGLIGTAAVFHSIYSDVKQVAQAARTKFPGDSVQALVACLQSDDVSFQDKNEAVWALGQIGDNRALQPLKNLYTGVECEKPCSKKNKICQYELEKAVEFCGGKFSATKWMYSRL